MGVRVSDIKVFAKAIDDTTKAQIDEIVKHPAFADKKIRIMPDCHAGAGCVIGFTAKLGDIVCPNLIGVDIGCGMLTVELGQTDIDLPRLDKVIRKHVPSGFNVHSKDNYDVSRSGFLCFDELKNTERLNKSLGTLGGGNHFIEIDEDAEGNKYLIIHSGSRNLGLQIANIYQRKAIETCDDDIPNSLKYLSGELADLYDSDMERAAGFACNNRYGIAERILVGMRWSEVSAWETVHNYIGSDNIIRKGAIQAEKDVRLLIPMNMRDGSIIAIGKGNDDWNCSAPHGAGRVMGRKEAKRKLDAGVFEKQMKGVYSTTICAETLDESPDCYKPMQDILDAIGDTVTVERIIKPIYNFKATGE